MRTEETNEDVRYSAITAMLSTLEFISQNMKNENERNFIMKVICENTQHKNEKVRVRAFQCLSEIGALYYVFLPNYMQNIFSVNHYIFFAFSFFSHFFSSRLPSMH